MPEPTAAISIRCPADPDPVSIHGEEQREREDVIDLRHAERLRIVSRIHSPLDTWLGYGGGNHKNKHTLSIGHHSHSAAPG